MTNYFIADLHLSHKNVINFTRKDGSKLRDFACIKEHDDYIIREINKIVKHDDKLYILGDVAFTSKGLDRLSELKCKNLYLVAGNHDTLGSASYLKYFKKIFGAIQYKNCILTHIPVHEQQLQERFTLNIHGHLHANCVEDPRYFNVSCEQLDFKPISFEEIIEKF